MKSWHRAVPWFVAAFALVSAACIIGPKHDDPMSDIAPPADDASGDNGFVMGDSTGGIDAGGDTLVTSPTDSTFKLDGEGIDGDGADGDGADATDGDAAEAPADADAMDAPDADAADGSDAVDAG